MTVRVQMNYMYYAVALIGVLWVFTAGVNSTPRDNCEELIVTGPRNLTNLTNAPLVYDLKANETHAARINCRADCLNYISGTVYNPELLIINTNDAKPMRVPAANQIGTGYSATYRNFSYCSTTNNYIEFEYDIYLDARLDNSVIICGIIKFVPRQSTFPCWGQSYAVVSYIAEEPTTPPPPPTTTTIIASPTILPSSTTVQPTISPSTTSLSTTAGLSSIIPPTICTISQTGTPMPPIVNPSTQTQKFTSTVVSLVVVFVIIIVLMALIIVGLSCKLMQVIAKSKRPAVEPILIGNIPAMRQTPAALTASQPQQPNAFC